MRLPSQWFLAVEPINLRCGMDRLLVWVQRSGGSASGSVGYVFRNRAGSRIKLLLIDGTGVWLCVRRLHAGRFCAFHANRSLIPRQAGREFHGMPVGASSQADYTDDSRWLGYDGLDRLTVANSRDQNARMQWGYGWGDGGFEYDALDNLRRFRMGPLDMRYHHDSQQRLQGITLGGAAFRSYAHNARGQMTQREHADRLYSLSWDSAHRLLSTQAPGHSESYRYDAHGHRVRTQRSGETVWSVYSRAGTLLFEQTSLGQNRRHIHLGARQVAETRNGQRRYLHTDHLGTPRVQTDAFGTVVQRDVRAPYGSVLAGFDYRQGAGFTGHMEDGATALTYMKARYYDPVAMRFLSPDPVYVDLGTGGNFNRYWYANNNPYKYVDPDGRQASCANAKNAAACAAAGMGGRQAAVDAAAKTVARDAAKIGVRGALANEIAQSDSVDPSSSTSKPNSQGGEQASATGGRTRGLPPEGVVPPVAKPEGLREGAPSRPSEERAGGRSLWDEDGGEWRYHPGDKHHNPHWDHNPHTEKFGPWQNVPIGDLPVYKPLF